MYYTDAQAGISYQFCGSGCGDFDFPADSDVPLPPNPLLEEHALHGNHGAQNGTINITNSMSINLVSVFALIILQKSHFINIHVYIL